MKCKRCPFHLVCTMGRLGDPYELRLCPDCSCISFVVEQKYITVDEGYQMLPGTEKKVIPTSAGVDLIVDPDVDPESILCTVNGERVMARVDGKLQAHIFNFTCELRPMTALRQAMFRDAMTTRHQELTNEGKMGDFDPVIINVTDPGPGGQQTFHIRKCTTCSGQFERANQYFAVTMYNLDNGDALPRL